MKYKSVLFLGDSITDCGRNREDLYDLGPGYPAFTAKKFAQMGYTGMTFINRGISGSRTRLLKERYEDDCLRFDADLISVLIGINDTWRRFDSDDPMTAEEFRSNYEYVLSRIRKDKPGAKILMLEQFLLPVMPERQAWREDLDSKICVTRELAYKYADAFIPLDGLLNARAVNRCAPQELSADGVHPTPMGHEFIADLYLKALDI